jgi:hypothetical protein
MRGSEKFRAIPDLPLTHIRLNLHTGTRTAQNGRQLAGDILVVAPPVISPEE